MFAIKTVFSENDLQQALDIRSKVFVDEQGIPRKMEVDGHDENAWHVLVRSNGLAVATGRLLMDDGGAGNLSRIAVLPPFRSMGLGKMVIGELEKLAEEQGAAQLYIYPHSYLENFYTCLGYHKVPGNYEVGNHRLIRMEKSLGQPIPHD